MFCGVCSSICHTGKSSRLGALACPKCTYVVCTACFVRWVCSSPPPEHACINCRAVLGLRFVLATLPAKAGKTYMAALVGKIHARELARIPAVMPVVERTLYIAEMRQTQADIAMRVADVHCELAKLRIQAAFVAETVPRVANFAAIRRQHLADKTALVRKLHGLRQKHTECDGNITAYILASTPGPCGNASAGCIGRIGADMHCRVCGEQTCPACMCTKQDGHVCCPADIASVQLLREETKPCPQCAVPIYKLAGCDHMWCTHCHTYFNWDTLAVQPPGHNPEHAAYLAATTDAYVHSIMQCGNPLDADIVPAYAQSAPGQYAAIVQSARTMAAMLDVPPYRSQPAYDDVLVRFVLAAGRGAGTSSMACGTDTSRCEHGDTHAHTPTHAYPHAEYTATHMKRDIQKIIILEEQQPCCRAIIHTMYTSLLALLVQFAERDTYAEICTLRKLGNAELREIHRVYGGRRYKYSRVDAAGNLTPLTFYEYRRYTRAK